MDGVGAEIAALVAEALEVTRDGERILNCIAICSMQVDALAAVAASDKYGPEVLAAVDALERLLSALSAAGDVVSARQHNAIGRLQALGLED